MKHRALLVSFSLLLACCLLPASERVELDRQVGREDALGFHIEVLGGLASVRSISSERIELWAQAPALELVLSHDTANTPLRLDVLNCLPDSVLSSSAGTQVASSVDGRNASCRFDLRVGANERLRIAPPDADSEEPFTFAVLSDVQSAIDRVHQVFERMNQDPSLRFVVSTGDLVDTGVQKELERFQRELAGLRMPFYSTVGNHEMGAEPRVWHQLFGPFNPHFVFKGVHFSLVDSGNATIDPHVYDWLDDWLDQARDEVHVVLTHLPPIDPVGLRGGSFRSRKEAAKLMRKLALGRVDALFLGHIHSYYAFSLAGVPSFISGGGGAIEERLDGIQRHYLKVDAVPKQGLTSIGLVRVD